LEQPREEYPGKKGVMHLIVMHVSLPAISKKIMPAPKDWELAAAKYLRLFAIAV
jgi:hypothetical protein